MKKVLSVAEKNVLRRTYCVNFQRERRQRLKKEHKCIWCGSKCKPITTYHQLCEKHKEKNKEKKEKIKLKIK